MKVFSAAIIVAVAMFSAYAYELYDDPDNYYNEPGYCVDVACADKIWEYMMSDVEEVDEVKKCTQNAAKTCVKELAENFGRVLTYTVNYYQETKAQSLCPQEKYNTLYNFLNIINYRRNLLINGIKDADKDTKECLKPWLKKSYEEVHPELNKCWKSTGAPECEEEKAPKC